MDEKQKTTQTRIISKDSRRALSFLPIVDTFERTITFFKISNLTKTKPVEGEEWEYIVNHINKTNQTTKGGLKIFIAEVFLIKRVEFTPFNYSKSTYELWSGMKLLDTKPAIIKEQFIGWDKDSFKLARAIKLFETFYQDPFNPCNYVKTKSEKYVDWDANDIPDEYRAQRNEFLKNIERDRNKNIEYYQSFFVKRQEEKSTRPAKFDAIDVKSVSV